MTSFWNIVGSSLLLAAAGMVLLRIAGPKSVAQMTVPQIATLITIGTVLGSDVGAQGVGRSVLAAAVFVSTLIAMEWFSLRWNRAERILKGTAQLLIEDGRILTGHIRKLRMTVDDIEKRLRIAGVSRVADVKRATLEDNGELGIELMPAAKPVTVGDLERILQEYFGGHASIRSEQEEGTANLFAEVDRQGHPGKIPQQLQ